MDGHDYEYQVANYLRNHGYTNVKVTRASSDFGVDIIAHKKGYKYAVQCKYYSNPVGVGAVQEVVAGKSFYSCDYAMVVTNNTFTQPAQTLAKSNNVILLDNITSNNSFSFKINNKFIKILLWCVYLFFVSAIVATTVKVVKDQSFWKAAYNIFCTAIIVLFPFWIRWLWRLIKYVFRRLYQLYISKKEQNYPNKQLKATQHPENKPIITPHTKKNAYVPLIVTQLRFVDKDIIFPAIDLIIDRQMVSTTLLQKNLNLNYASSANIINQLEQLKIVGPFNGNNPRQILISKEQWKNIKNEINTH